MINTAHAQKERLTDKQKETGAAAPMCDMRTPQSLIMSSDQWQQSSQRTWTATVIRSRALHQKYRTPSHTEGSPKELINQMHVD